MAADPTGGVLTLIQQLQNALPLASGIKKLMIQDRLVKLQAQAKQQAEATQMSVGYPSVPGMYTPQFGSQPVAMPGTGQTQPSIGGALISAFTSQLAQRAAAPSIQLAGLRIPGLAPLAGAAGRGMARVLGLNRTSTGKISGVMLGSGQWVSKKSMIDLAKRIGIDAAALALGITVVELAEAIATQPRRRRRGISAADLRTTRRTIRNVTNIGKDLKALSTGRRVCR